MIYIYIYIYMIYMIYYNIMQYNYKHTYISQHATRRGHLPCPGAETCGCHNITQHTVV